MSASSLFDRLGGEIQLRPIINDFVDRMMNDMMIGFFFRQVDPARLKEMEYQFTARFLGADIAYEGKPIGAAHRPHPIMGGQFDRRKQILAETIRNHDVAPDIQTAWLAHVDALRPQITRDAGGICQDPLSVADEDR